MGFLKLFSVAVFMFSAMAFSGQAEIPPAGACTVSLHPLSSERLDWIVKDVPHGELLLNGRWLLTLVRVSPDFRRLLQLFAITGFDFDTPRMNIRSDEEPAEFVLKMLEKLQSFKDPKVRRRVAELLAERLHQIHGKYLEQLNGLPSFDSEGEVTEPFAVKAAAARVFRSEGSSPLGRSLSMTAMGAVRVHP